MIILTTYEKLLKETVALDMEFQINCTLDNGYSYKNEQLSLIMWLP